MLTKSDIRHTIKCRKQKYPSSILRVMSASIMRLLKSHPHFIQAETVLLYHSLLDEPYTHSLLREYASTKRLLLPVVSGNELVLRQYVDDRTLYSGAFQISEPEGVNFTNYEEIQFAVIPGVAFDDSGNRLGRGCGYYDRLLVNPSFLSTYKLGVCFHFQKMDSIPIAPYDVPVDEVLINL